MEKVLNTQLYKKKEILYWYCENIYFHVLVLNLRQILYKENFLKEKGIYSACQKNPSHSFVMNGVHHVKNTVVTQCKRVEVIFKRTIIN